MKHYGATLYESDDPARVRDVATVMRSRGVRCEICAGVSTIYRILEVSLVWDRAYLAFREGLARWARERLGVLL